MSKAGETDIVIIGYSNDLAIEDVSTQIGGTGDDIITAIAAEDKSVLFDLVIVGSTALPEDVDDDDSAEDHLFGLEAARESVFPPLSFSLLRT